MAEAEQIAAKAQAEIEAVTTGLAATRQGVDAEGARQSNEAGTVLSDDARAGRLRAKLLDHLAGVVRESVKLMEKIDAIKILHVKRLGGGAGRAGNITDEVIDAALRYRAGPDE